MPRGRGRSVLVLTLEAIAYPVGGRAASSLELVLNTSATGSAFDPDDLTDEELEVLMLAAVVADG